MEGGACEPPLFFPLFIPQCQSHQKNCLLRTSRSPAALASARGRPLSSPDARGALSSPLLESRRSCSNYRSYSISDLFDFNAERRLFLSPHVVSPSHTRSHILGSVSRPPFCSLGKGSWTERFTFRKGASASYFTGSLALSGPGSPMWRSCWGGSGQKEERL